MGRPKKLPEALLNALRAFCSSYKEAEAVFTLSRKQSKDLMAGKPIKVTDQQKDLIVSVLSNHLRYALASRIQALLEDPKACQAFLLWVHTAADMVDMFRRLKAIRDQCKFINGFDPFLASMNSLALAMAEVEKFLNQLHENLPWFDEHFFGGTSFLAQQETVIPIIAKRVPTSVDILSLSPNDRKRYNELTTKNRSSDGHNSEERVEGRVRQEPDNPCDQESS